MPANVLLAARERRMRALACLIGVGVQDEGAFEKRLNDVTQRMVSTSRKHTSNGAPSSAAKCSIVTGWHPASMIAFLAAIRCWIKSALVAQRKTRGNSGMEQSTIILQGPEYHFHLKMFQTFP